MEANPSIRPPLAPLPKLAKPGIPENEPKNFPSYHQAPNLNPRTRTLCEILTHTPVAEIQNRLSSCGITPLPELVEEVLKLSYNSPSAAVSFFRWAGLIQKHSPHAWNLMVDLLGKNKLYEPMWDAIRSMKQEGALSIATFVSAIESYCSAGRSDEAIMTFDVMERYGVEPNVVCVNAILSAMCREGKLILKAAEFYDRVKAKIPPNGDTFAILLDECEKERNVFKAKTIFGEMVIRIGWSPQYLAAYDSLLTTLVKGSEVDEALKFLAVMKGKNCSPGLKFFSKAIDILVKLRDSVRTKLMWNLMIDSALVPSLVMYNSVIGMLCNNNEVDSAFIFLDGMPLYGAFPDSLTYNMIFQCLIKNKKIREARRFYYEMVKNECPPSNSNFASAIRMFLDYDDPEMAVELWEFMLANRVLPLEDSANALLNGMTALDRPTEVVKFLEDILYRRITIHDATMEKMRMALRGRSRSVRDTFERLTIKWKPS